MADNYPSMDPSSQGRPERPVSKQLPPLPPELEKQKKDVPEELYNAVGVSLKHYQDYNKDHNIKKFFDTFKSFIDSKPDVSNAGITVRIHTVTTGNTYGPDKALLAQVKDSGRITLEETDMSRCHVIILFCQISSRPGSDVQYAMSDLPGDKPVILVLMHHSRKAYYTDTENWSDTYPKVVLGVNVFYHETVKGLLSCKENKLAVQKIKKKLQKYISH
ncbi:uncharacterized protein LOC114426659 [Parambassis ranga]|uniref:Uncharacterized protein LOC114426659 n=1 Tax=Parambassis ranga TaxID=210632 RepID=A0A6P7HN29_9TELE|nr:uncharacterized protein LOC114426659 [Parambassis ranga]